MTRSNHSTHEFPIQRHRIREYYYWLHILYILLVGIWFVGIGLVIALIYAFTWGLYLPGKQAEALHYWLDGKILRIDQGVFFLQRKAIPLDRITDITLVQGPLLRNFGLWSLKIQTAGNGGESTPEAVMVGLVEAEEIRDQLIKARDAILK
jgi:putative membrane protein